MKPGLCDVRRTSDRRLPRLRPICFGYEKRPQAGRLYGQSFMKLNLLDGWFHMEVIDPQDVLVDRFMNELSLLILPSFPPQHWSANTSGGSLR
jgi:hypothetical protein